MLTIFTEWHK